MNRNRETGTLGTIMNSGGNLFEYIYTFQVRLFRGHMETTDDLKMLRLEIQMSGSSIFISIILISISTD